MRTIARIIGVGLAMVMSSTVMAQERRPVLIGYVAAFKGLDMSIGRLPPRAYTHLNVAFANPDAEGRFVRAGQLACMPGARGEATGLGTLRDAVRRMQAGGARVSVSLGGGTIPGCSGDWRVLLSEARRADTIDALVSLVEAAGLDGVDVDLEGALLTEIDRAGDYTPFVAALSAELRARGKLLSCATASYEGGMIPERSIPYFDYVNIMSYDAIGSSWGTPGDEHSPFAMAERDLALWRGKGVPPDRLVLGVPFYGYGFGGLAPNWSYRDIRQQHGATAARRDVVGEACAGCAYITYNGPETIARKARLAAQEGAGVMVWEVSQDTPDHALIGAIRRGVTEQQRSNR